MTKGKSSQARRMKVAAKTAPWAVQESMSSERVRIGE